MGMLDKLFGWLQPKEEPIARDDYSEKLDLAAKVVTLVNQINRKNSFDSSLWNLANKSEYDLAQMKNTSELKDIIETLKNRLNEIERNEKIQAGRGESSYQKSLWTGETTHDMNKRDLGRAQDRWD